MTAYRTNPVFHGHQLRAGSGRRCPPRPPTRRRRLSLYAFAGAAKKLRALQTQTQTRQPHERCGAARLAVGGRRAPS